MYSPAVITSKQAQNHYKDIVEQHSDIVTAMANQQQSVNMFNQQKAIEQQNQKIMDNEMEKERMATQTSLSKDAVQSNKDVMTFQQKNAELEIKRAALSQV